MSIRTQRQNLPRSLLLLVRTGLGKDVELGCVEGHVAEGQAGRDALRDERSAFEISDMA